MLRVGSNAEVSCWNGHRSFLSMQCATPAKFLIRFARLVSFAHILNATEECVVMSASLEHFQRLAAEVVEDLHGDLSPCGLGERTGVDNSF
jgi:hypothetical protein